MKKFDIPLYGRNGSFIGHLSSHDLIDTGFFSAVCEAPKEQPKAPPPPAVSIEDTYNAAYDAGYKAAFEMGRKDLEIEYKRGYQEGFKKATVSIKNALAHNLDEWIGNGPF